MSLLVETSGYPTDWNTADPVKVQRYCLPPTVGGDYDRELPMEWRLVDLRIR